MFSSSENVMKKISIQPTQKHFEHMLVTASFFHTMAVYCTTLTASFEQHWTFVSEVDHHLLQSSIIKIWRRRNSLIFWRNYWSEYLSVVHKCHFKLKHLKNCCIALFLQAFRKELQYTIDFYDHLWWNFKIYINHNSGGDSQFFLATSRKCPDYTALIKYLVLCNI